MLHTTLPDLNPLGAKLAGVWIPTFFIPASPSLPPQAFQDWESCLEETGVSKVRLKMKATGALFEKPFSDQRSTTRLLQGYVLEVQCRCALDVVEKC